MAASPSRSVTESTGHLSDTGREQSAANCQSTSASGPIPVRRVVLAKLGLGDGPAAGQIMAKQKATVGLSNGGRQSSRHRRGRSGHPKGHPKAVKSL